MLKCLKYGESGMGRLTIKTYKDPILRQKATAVASVGEEERRLAEDMIETMRSSNGIGLAAPQVGINKRIIVVEDLEGNKSTLTLVNPRILKRKGMSSFCEGCLSVPDITSDVIRPEFIVVEALGLDGRKLKIEAGGLLARVMQHEVDHLDGILFIDRIGFLKRKKIIRKISSSKVCMEL